MQVLTRMGARPSLAKGVRMELRDDDLARAAAASGLSPAAIVVLDLERGARAELDPWLPLYPASTIKVPLVAAALAERATHRIDPAAPIRIGAENLTANDLASPLVLGYTTGLSEVMHLAIARSDNVATNLLFDLVGRERASALALDFGLRATAFHRKLSGSEPLIADPGWDGVHRNTHPAADAAHLYRAIADDAVAGASELRAMLGAQAWNEKLSPGLHSGDTFLHKTGDTSEVAHDGGILTTREGRRYVIVVHTGMPSCGATDAALGAFMQRIRPAL